MQPYDEILQQHYRDMIIARSCLPKRGKWIKEADGMIKCSVCGGYPEYENQCYTPFCCLCGANMMGHQQKTRINDGIRKESNAVQIKMKLNRKTDADILAKLDAAGNKQGYIKRLIRADMERAD